MPGETAKGFPLPPREGEGSRRPGQRTEDRGQRTEDRKSVRSVFRPSPGVKRRKLICLLFSQISVF
ncbi:MAG: hypothetical protein LBD06_13085 [Candidatus Accumulibacter sp.]|nr:hypothetical protein [Accumulibacter sp.]